MDDYMQVRGESDGPVHAGETLSSQSSVLVVDDEPSVRDIVGRILRKAGFQVLTANNGTEAVAIFRRDPAAVALILLDLTMPQMDGRQTFLEIRRLRSDVPVIISSGYGDQDAVQDFSNGSPPLFLPKPYERRLLLDKVHSALNSKG